MGLDPALEKNLNEIQLQLEGLAIAITKQRERIEGLTADDVERPEAEAILVPLQEARQALADRYRQLLKEVG
jgi:hypothetical protein